MADPTPDEPSKAAKHWSNVATAVHDAVGGKLDARKQAHLAKTLERFERELMPTLAPFLAELVDNPDVPEPIRQLLGTITEPEHFTQSLLLGFAVGSVIGPVLGTAVAPYVQTLANAVWPGDPSIPLSPSIAAAAVLKGVLSEAEGAARSRVSGIGADVFGLMVQAAGQSIGIEEALLLRRRDQIDDAHLTEIVKYSNINPAFYADVPKLRYSAVPAAEAITGALKGHISDAEATTMIAHAGIDPVNFPWLRAAAGRPPGIEQMLHLRNRNGATTADVLAAVRQSDINDDYWKFIDQLGTYIPPPRSIVPMLRSGAITTARAQVLFTENGLRPEDAAAFITEATSSSGTTGKELSASLVTRLYEAKVIDRPTALARLTALKYSAADAGLYLDLADETTREKLTNAETTRIHSLYVHRKITRAEAGADLAKVGQPAAAVTQLLAFWDFELTTVVEVLPVSQLQEGYRRGIITLTQFVADMHARGWAGIDVKILAANAWPPTGVPDEVKALNPANL